MNKSLCAALVSFMTLTAVAAQGQTYSVLHGFAGVNGPGTAGSANPNGPLTLLNGNLYGVTRYGGAYDPSNSIGWGTVYSINASSGAGDLIYSFVNGQNACQHPNGVNQTDGVEPFTGLTPYTFTGGQTVLYGTTIYGGNVANRSGVIFSISSTGEECVVYDFGQGGNGVVQDGYKPYAGLVYDPETGFLYGTTELGGAPVGSGLQGCGTIYQFDPNTLTEKVLYSFSGGTNGCMSRAPLILVNGILYGTTSGLSDDQSVPSTSGTVFGFNIATNKLEYNYAFQGGLADGSFSQAPVVYDQAHNMLYGTTTYGGVTWNSGSPPQSGYGTIFQVDLSNNFSEKPIYFFQDAQDGIHPLTGLVYDGVSTYYTTSSEGPTVTTKTGTVTEGGALIGGTLSPLSGVVLHTFTGTNGDGYSPNGGLIFENGVLYGTTYQGGGATTCSSGCGTVFKYVP